MAYRQLCVVAFAMLGLVGAGCAGDTRGSAGAPDTGDDPPTNADQTPGSGADEHPATAEAIPGTAEEVPSNVDGGGRAEGLCRELCQVVSACQDGPNSAASATCTRGCILPPELVPCADLYVTAVSCLLDVGFLCDDDDEPGPGQGPGQQQQRCQGPLAALEACDEQYGTPEPDPDPDPDPVMNCTPQGGCSCDDDACASCECAFGEGSMLCDTACANR